ncbi:unnamed protein product [Oikopleura dioica]|uniref:long-chain-fatty-acid--CoA ligase n=1 Tax=Oikopleura dioica TaxID=34765 RepID=E4Y8L4_OIKDI|nr:unnamed protein product [Oikopleura dioica]
MLTMNQFLIVYKDKKKKRRKVKKMTKTKHYPAISLYDTLGKDAVSYILNHIEAKCVFVGDEKKLEDILSILDELRFLEVIVTFEGSGWKIVLSLYRILCTVDTVSVKSGRGFEYSNEKNLRSPAKDIATINYTSGTTGNPKGAVLSHENVTTLALGIITWFLPLPVNSDDRWFSYLPMAHVFERSVRCILFTIGGQFWFSSGNLVKLLDELAIVQPTVFGTVPRVTNRLYDRIKAAMAESPLKSWLISSAQVAKRNLLDRGIVTRSTWWDYFVLSKLQKLVGGKVHTWVSGAAPLVIDPKVRAFVREVFGCHVIESYGTTENVGCGCATTFVNFTKDDGSVGPPQPWNDVKLASVPDMDYFAEDMCGEICFRGANNMIGYFKEPEMTKEAIDSDGWLHTGDIGRWDELGNLHIFDRKKNIYKLAQGEYISPEKIEGVLAKHPLVEQIFVWGSSYHHFNIAVLVFSKEFLQKKFSTKTSVESLIQNEEVLAWVHDEMEQYGRSEGLKGFEIPKRIILEKIQFTVDNKLLTPTQKAKRPAIYKKYKTQIDDLYCQ